MNEAVARTVERALFEGVLSPDETVTFYSDGRDLHGSSRCPNIREAVTLTVSQIAALPVPENCTCQGVLSSRLTVTLAASAQAFDNIDDEAGGHIDHNWMAIHQRLTAAALDSIWERRNLEQRPKLRQLRQRNTEAVDRITRRSADRLGTDQLVRAMAAQAITHNVTADEALSLSVWGRGKRIHYPNANRTNREHERVYDATLEQALVNAAPVTVYVFPGQHRRPSKRPLPTALQPDICAELALYLWAHHLPVDRTVSVALPEPAAQGAFLMTAEHARHRIGVTFRHDLDEDTLETARVLWADEHHSWSSFDEAAEAARTL